MSFRATILLACLSVGHLASAIEPSALGSSAACEQGETLFELAPLEGPLEAGQRAPVFIQGDDAWKESEVFKSYRALAPLAERMNVESMLTAVGRASARVAASTSFTTPNGRGVRDRVQRRLQQLSKDLSLLEPNSGVWAAFRDGAGTGRTHWEAGDLDAGSPGLESQLVYFSGSADAFALVASRDVDPGERIDNKYFVYTTSEEALEIRSVIDLVFHLVDREFPIEEIQRNLARNDQAWINYLQNGFSQYPWELMLNSSLIRSSWDDPPSGQIVLLHPEPAFLVGADSADETEGQLAVLVHVLGYVWYPNAERDWFIGASSSLSIPNDSDLGLGYGGTLHFGHAALGSSLSYLSAGLFYQEGTDDLGVAVSVDVWKFMANPDVGQLIDLFNE